MDEQPTTLATHVTVGTSTDAEGVAAATGRLRRELPDLDADAVELPQEGELPPGTRAVRLAPRGAPGCFPGPRLPSLGRRPGLGRLRPGWASIDGGNEEFPLFRDTSRSSRSTFA